MYQKRLINITFYIRLSLKLKPLVVLRVCRLTQLRRTSLRTQQKLVEIPNAQRVGVCVFRFCKQPQTVPKKIDLQLKATLAHFPIFLKCCSHCLVSSKEITKIKDNFCYTLSSFTVFTGC